MRVILDLIDEPDSVWMLILIGLLTWVGSHMVANTYSLRRWGERIAAVTFVAYLGYAIMRFEPKTADAFVGIAFRGLLSLGLALGCSWIVLAVVGFVNQIALLRLIHAVRNAAHMRGIERLQREKEEKERLRLEAEEAERAQRPIVVVLSRTQRIAQAVAQAKTDHDVECDLLRNAGLDEDELEFALFEVRSRYLHSIKEQMK